MDHLLFLFFKSGKIWKVHVVTESLLCVHSFSRLTSTGVCIKSTTLWTEPGFDPPLI